MIPPKIAAQLDQMQMVRSRLTFTEEMPPRNSLFSSILVTDLFEQHHALPCIRNLSHGNGNINNRFGGQPADCCASHMLNGKRVLTQGNTQPIFFFGKQVMPSLIMRHESNGSSF
jgi:hypothetical protein